MDSLYLIALLPPNQLSEQIDEIRHECADKFNVKAALKPPVHITFYKPFKVPRKDEDRVVKQLKQVSAQNTSFDVSLNNFNSFNTQVLYIDVLKSKEIGQLNKNITAVFKEDRKQSEEYQSKSAFKPHITIAYRDIQPEVFPLIWDEYKDRKFKRSFRADRFSLLKHDGKRWKVFREFDLHSPNQLSLFY